ncbi:16S rRNA (uracil(1498)-N(3))-methyltransferase [Haloechinothrix salitolerans]|uniref:Ribosomal RNA small subunit methyltransferase E n=1 Tax=Haloechinothrix salitolerans TaxID=926830 RepID=A0ABW2BZ12_9PSEU
MPLFLVDALPSGGEFVLDGEEARHAATVRRTRVGERVMLGDGTGGIARCVVAEVRSGKNPALTLSVERRTSVPPPEPRVTIVQALVKGDRGELAVELATEAGADAIVPWRAARCVARWDDGPRGAKALARWRASARAATKQGRRPWLPEVRDPVDLAGVSDLVRAADAALVLDGEASHGIGDVTLPSSGELVVIVGPEGGITDDERDALVAGGAVPMRLGPSVLRTSTAAAVALGALGALTTRWA